MELSLVLPEKQNQIAVIDRTVASSPLYREPLAKTMTDAEFDNYLAAACDELDQKYRGLVDQYGFGTHDNFVVEYEEQLLSFFKNERRTIEAKILPIASHVPEKNSLIWFWSNRNLPEHVRAPSAAIKKLYDVTGYEMFRENSVECDEDMAWEIAALACKCLEAKGVYRIPHSNLNTYVLILEVAQFG